MIAEVLDGLAKEWRGRQRAVEQKVKAQAIALCKRFPDLHLISHKPIPGVRSCPLDIRGTSLRF